MTGGSGNTSGAAAPPKLNRDGPHESEEVQALRNSTSAHKGWLTRRYDRLVAMVGVMNNNPNPRTAESLRKLATEWENKSLDVEEGYLNLSGEDPTNAAYYNLKMNETNKFVASTLATIDGSLAQTERDIQKQTFAARSAAPAQPQPQMKVRSDLKPENLVSDATPLEFKAWEEQFTTYFEASRLGLGTAREQQQTLLVLLDSELRENIMQSVERTRVVFQSQLPDASPIDSCMRILQKHFMSKNPVNLRRLEFAQMSQDKGQTLLQFANRLRGLWMECDFDNMSAHEWLVTILANGCRSTRQKEKIRDMKGNSWKEIQDSLRQWEADANEDKVNTSVQANQVQSNGQKGGRPKRDTPAKEALKGKCYKCGSPKHDAKTCTLPADFKCNNCGKPGHKASVCMSKPGAQGGARPKQQQRKGKVRQVDDETAEDRPTATYDSDNEVCEAVGTGREVLFS